MWLSGDGRDDLIVGLDDLKRSNSDSVKFSSTMDCP